jgi:type IX secretion system substrate protein
MKRFTMFACLTVAMVFALVSFAGNTPTYVDGHNSVITTSGSSMNKAARDTVELIGPWGSGAQANGQFEDSEAMGGGANMNGWESADLSLKTEEIWHVDTYNAVAGVYSAWCGEIRFDVCGEGDVVGGYGQNYHELLVFRGTVADNAAPCNVVVTATVHHNTEAGWDYVHLGYFKAGLAIETVWTGDGVATDVAINQTMIYAGGEYVGDDNDEVRIAWQVLSDGAADDSDCQNPTNGAIQVDNITVTMDNDLGAGSYYDDFELNTLGNWAVEFPLGVGDYTHLRTLLRDADACRSDYSPTACFLADDIMFDTMGLPSQTCQDWCYGNGGYIVNTQGGAAGPTFVLNNQVMSPVVEWPAGYPGGSLEFDVYRHFELGSASSGFFYVWGVRSINTGIAADIELAPWVARGFVYYGGPDYIRGGDLGLISLLEPAATHLQVRVGVDEAGPSWGWDTDNGTPAPYFDNVRVLAFDQAGPGMNTREIDLAQSSFPSNHLLSLGVDMGLNDIRFDMATDISLQTETYNLPGDSLVVVITAVRSSTTDVATLVEADVAGAFAPRLMFSLKGNPAFDASVRTFAAEQDWADLGGVITSQVGVDYVGYTYGFPAFHNGARTADEFGFDLPDENFFYPGDVIHYYFESWDELDGGYESSTLPNDLTGFGVFDTGPLTYASAFKCRGLPTMFDDAGDQPSILFWNDFANRGGQQEWHGAFESLGLFAGVDSDLYYTMGPSSGVGNGIGGRSAFGQLLGYDAIVYSSGDLTSFTISNQNFVDDAGDDTGVINSWLESGNKLFFATGDDIATDLEDQGGIAATLLSASFGVLLGGNDVGGFLGNDTAPLVTPVIGNSVFFNTVDWVAYGGCNGINTFDAVTPLTGCEQLAYFNDGTTSYAAATRNENASLSTVVYLPYDLMNVRSPMKALQPAALAARAQVLEEVLFNAGGIASDPQNAVGADLPVFAFGAENYPNPFNPITKIEFSLPTAGKVSLKVFSVRGELVKTLINEVRPAGTDHIMWDATSDQGKRVSSGVYFYQLNTADNSIVKKMTVVK